MKTLLGLWLLTGYAFAQGPAPTFRRDTVPSIFSPDNMPVARSNNSFYRYQVDPNTVMRATTDNLPVSLADSSKRYTMGQLYQQYRRTPELPSLIPPMPRVIPKKFK